MFCLFLFYLEEKKGVFLDLHTSVGVGKAPGTANFVLKLLSQNQKHKILVFAHHKDCLNHIEARLRDVIYRRRSCKELNGFMISFFLYFRKILNTLELMVMLLIKTKGLH